MNVNRQASRSASTRAKLIRAARKLFAGKGYASVGTEEIVRRAGVTRGALYHQFADKAELFAAVLRSVEETTNARVGAAVAAAGPDDPIAAMRLATAVFLDVCTEPGMARIMLIDAPAVLGAQAESEASETDIALVVQLLSRGVELGQIAPQPVMPLARILLGALREAAVFLARAPDPAAARDQVGAVLDRIIGSVAAPGEQA